MKCTPVAIFVCVLLTFLISHVSSKKERVLVPTTPLLFGAWNVQRLGTSKMNNPKVVDSILKVMIRYDLIVIQEIVDVSQTVPYMLLEKLNEVADNSYAMVLSDRVGETTYKEQYAMYYKTAELNVLSKTTFEDTKNLFAYDPLVVRFSGVKTTVPDFTIVCLHASPTVAVEEINSLTTVYKSLVDKDAIIMGDFNAGCSYVSNNDWDNILLRSDSTYTWLIPDWVDTTTTATFCPYDRIVVTGDMTDAAIEISAQPYQFDYQLNLSEEKAKDVSDHYPVEVSVRCQRESSVSLYEGIQIESVSTSAAIDVLRKRCLEEYLQSAQGDRVCGNEPSPDNANEGILRMTYQKTVKEIQNVLNEMNAKYPAVFTQDVILLIEEVIYIFVDKQILLKFEVYCSEKDSFQCLFLLVEPIYV